MLTGRAALFTYLAVTCVSIGLLVPMWFLYYYPLDVDLPVYTRGSCMIATQYRYDTVTVFAWNMVMHMQHRLRHISWCRS